MFRDSNIDNRIKMTTFRLRLTTFVHLDDNMHAYISSTRTFSQRIPIRQMLIKLNPIRYAILWDFCNIFLLLLLSQCILLDYLIYNIDLRFYIWYLYWLKFSIRELCRITNFSFVLFSKIIIRQYCYKLLNIICSINMVFQQNFLTAIKRNVLFMCLKRISVRRISWKFREITLRY